MKMRGILWLGAIALLIYLLSALSSIMLPFVAGFAIAYLLDPLADKLESFGLPRLAATGMITFIFTIAIVLAALFGLPLVAEQILIMVEVLPQYAEAARDWAMDMSNSDQSAKIIQDLSDDALDTIGSVGQALLLRSLSFLNVLALIVITPVVAFYMLNDWDRMIAQIDKYLPPEKASAIRKIAKESDDVLAGFLHGQGLVCLILGGFYATGLWFVGLNGGILAGLLAGLVSFIPYVGATFGIILAGILGFVQFWPNWEPLLIIGAIFVIGQFVEGNFLTPKLVGERVRLHPVWMMFALLAFGALFGFIGLLLAVPIAAVVGVIVRYGVYIYEDEVLHIVSHNDEGAGE